MILRRCFASLPSARSFSSEVLKGVFNPITIPFCDGTYDLDEVAFQSNLTKWLDTSLTGHVILGSTGEFPSLTVEEKKRVFFLAATVRDSTDPTRPLIAGTGHYGCEREVLDLTRYAADIGFGAAMSIPPHYYTPVLRDNVSLICSFYERLADESPIPIILYTIPQFVGFIIPPEAVSILSSHPNIIGMKDSAADVDLMSLYVEAVRKAGTEEKFSVLSGSGILLLDMLEIGAVGGINAVSNVVPDEAAAILRLFQEGEFEKAREMQDLVAGVNIACNDVPNCSAIGGVKHAMEMVGMLGGPCRPPLQERAPEMDVDELRLKLVELGVELVE